MQTAVHTAGSVPLTAGWKWLAVVISLGVLGLLYVVTGVSSGWNPWKLVEGADGRASTSKFQWLAWIIVILFAYTVLWVLRAKQGNYTAISQVPVNLLTVLGFSTGTAAAAKGITSAYVQSNRMTKAPVTDGPGTQGGSQSQAKRGGLLQDDTGVPELAKIQMMGFTLVAIGVFLATLTHQIVTNSVSSGLPNIDSSLLVLMGISQGGYLGKKLVTFGSPTLYPLATPQAAPGATVTLKGAGLGRQAAGSLLTLNGTPIPFSSWTDSAVEFDVPGTNPAGGGAWAAKQSVQLAVVVNGQPSNSVTLTVT